jgi:hypothetical protein
MGTARRVLANHVRFLLAPVVVHHKKWVANANYRGAATYDRR